MSDDNPLNDQELDSIERQLQRVTLPPSPRQREDLLYACGVAAGRSQMKRRLTAVTSIAVVLMGVTTSLGVALVTRGERSLSNQTVTGSPSSNERLHQPIEQPAVSAPDEWTGADRRDDALTASSNSNELLLADVGQTPVTLPSNADRPSPQPILTAAGRSIFTDL